MHFRILLSVLSLLMYSGIANAAPYAYIANSADDTVSVIDTATNAVSTISVGNGPYGVTVNPIGGRVYVSNQIGKTISVIDTYNNSVTSIPASGSLAYMPGGLAVNSAGTRLFVADSDGASLTVFDVATKAALGTIVLGANQPDGIAIGPKDGSGNYKVFVTCFGSGVLKVISANDATAITGWTTATVTVGAGPKGVTVNTDASRVYVANWDSNSVTVINGSTNAIVGSAITVGSKPAGISVNPAGTKVYVANSGASTISVIDVATSGVTTVNLTNNLLQPFGISVSPDGTKVITSNYYGNKATVIDASTNAIIADPVVGNAAMALGNFAGPVRYPVTTTVTTPSWYGTGGTISAPAGQVTMSPSGVIMVGSGQTPTLSIAADPNFALSNVIVNGTGQGAVTSVTLPAVSNALSTVTASFNRTQWSVTVANTGSGTGSIVSNVGGINCGTTCSAAYPDLDSFVSFTSMPAAGSQHIAWGGACSASLTAATCWIKFTEAEALLKASPDGTFDITANIGLLPVTSGPVRIIRGATTTYYQNLPAAYLAAVSGDVIDTIIGDFTFTPNRFAIGVTLKSGWTNNTYPAITGASNITGGLIISQGSVTIGLGSVVIK